MINDVFYLVQSIRKSSTKWIGILSPAFVAIIVFIFDLNILQFFLQLFPEVLLKVQESPRVGLTLNTVFLTVVFNVILAIFKYPGEIKVKILNNNRKNHSQFNGIDSNHRPVTIHLDGTIEFKSTIVKIILLNFVDFKLKVNFPSCIDPTLESKQGKGFLSEVSNREFHIDLKKVFEGTNKTKRDFYIKYGIINNSGEKENEDITVSVATKLVPTIFLALFFDVKFEDYNIEINEI